MEHWNIRVYGRVQGVYYRASAKEKAEKLGLTGFVKNDKDGSVYIEAEGEEDMLQKLADWCLEGPQLAKVERVDVMDGAWQGYETFEIKK